MRATHEIGVDKPLGTWPPDNVYPCGGDVSADTDSVVGVPRDSSPDALVDLSQPCTFCLIWVQPHTERAERLVLEEGMTSARNQRGKKGVDQFSHPFRLEVVERQTGNHQVVSFRCQVFPDVGGNQIDLRLESRPLRVGLDSPLEVFDKGGVQLAQSKTVAGTKLPKQVRRHRPRTRTRLEYPPGSGVLVQWSNQSSCQRAAAGQDGPGCVEGSEVLPDKQTRRIQLHRSP